MKAAVIFDQAGIAGDTAGVAEDAATGSASGPLGAYVAERGIVSLGDPIEIVIRAEGHRRSVHARIIGWRIDEPGRAWLTR